MTPSETARGGDTHPRKALQRWDTAAPQRVGTLDPGDTTTHPDTLKGRKDWSRERCFRVPERVGPSGSEQMLAHIVVRPDGQTCGGTMGQVPQPP